MFDKLQVVCHKIFKKMFVMISCSYNSRILWGQSTLHCQVKKYVIQKQLN